MFDPTDPRNIPHLANIASKPVVILCNGPQIDRLQAQFWDRLNAIQQQADSELIVAGVNRIGIAESCLKNRYKPDVVALVDKPFFRTKGPKDLDAESAQRARERAEEARAMAVLKSTAPKQYEIWEAAQKRISDMESAQAAAKIGSKAEQIPTETTMAFLRSMTTVAGVSERVVSNQAVWYLQPQIPNKDVVLNMDQSIRGPANRAKMLFTTADWLVNWLSRIGCREFYFYGMSMKDGRHCKTQGLVEDDDYSWTEPSRQKTCFNAWNALRDAFPGLKLYNCDRKSLFVEKGEMEFKIPPQLDPSYKLLSDSDCIARRDQLMAFAAREAEPAIKQMVETAAIAKLRAQMEADKARVQK